MNIKNNIKFYWRIGKEIYKTKNKFCNSTEIISTYYSYRYGNSYLFNRENINYMKRFFLCFPIYLDKFNDLTWSHYKLLINVGDCKSRYLYFWIALFCKCSVSDLKFLIDNNYVNII